MPYPYDYNLDESLPPASGGGNPPTTAPFNPQYEYPGGYTPPPGYYGAPSPSPYPSYTPYNGGIPSNPWATPTPYPGGPGGPPSATIQNPGAGGVATPGLFPGSPGYDPYNYNPGAGGVATPGLFPGDPGYDPYAPPPPTTAQAGTSDQPDEVPAQSTYSSPPQTNAGNNPPAGYYSPAYLASIGYEPGQGIGSQWPGGPVGPTPGSTGGYGVGGEGGSFFGGRTNLSVVGGGNIGNLGGGGPVGQLGGAFKAPWYYNGPHARWGGHSTDTPEGLGMLRYSAAQHRAMQARLGTGVGRGQVLSKGIPPTHAQ